MIQLQSKWRRRYGGRPGAVDVVTDVNASEGTINYKTEIPGVSQKHYGATTIEFFRDTRTLVTE